MSNSTPFPERIAEALKTSNYTQKELAKILNIAEGNITHWKNGKNLPSVDILYRLCILLDESADYLLGLEDETGAKTHINNSFNNFNNSGNIKF